MKNPYLTEYDSQSKEIIEAISDALRSGNYILGQSVLAFEKQFSDYLSISNTIGVANGLDALQLSLMALEIGPGDEIITTSLSAVATTLAITRVGATPIFVDVDDYFHIDVNKIEEKITKNTKAIIPVHLYGQSVQIDQVNEICKRNELFLIEDVAQAHGAEFGGKKLGTFGTTGAFSFYPTKNLGAYGDAGAIVTKDGNIAEKCIMLRNYGQKSRYVHELRGINSRLDEIQAAILNFKIKYLNENNTKRREIARKYSNELKDISGLQIPLIRENSKPVFHQYVIQTKKRDKLLEYLNENEIPAIIHYPIPIHKQPCYSEFNNISLKKTEQACEEIISLPIHPYMSNEDVEKVIHLVKKFFRAKQ